MLKMQLTFGDAWHALKIVFAIKHKKRDNVQIFKKYGFNHFKIIDCWSTWYE